MEAQGQQKVFLTDRKYLLVEGVQRVENFDEKEILLETFLGFLLLRGEGMHITRLDLDTGSLTVEGYINSIHYQENKGGHAGARGKGILQRLFK